MIAKHFSCVSLSEGSAYGKPEKNIVDPVDQEGSITLQHLRDTFPNELVDIVVTGGRFDKEALRALQKANVTVL